MNEHDGKKIMLRTDVLVKILITQCWKPTIPFTLQEGVGLFRD